MLLSGMKIGEKFQIAISFLVFHVISLGNEVAAEAGKVVPQQILQGLIAKRESAR